MEKLITDSRMASHIEELQHSPGLQVEPLGLADLRAEFEAFKEEVRSALARKADVLPKEPPDDGA